MRDIGRTKVDEFEWIGFKHETEKLLVRFGLQHNGFAIEAFIKKDFVWWQVAEARIPQNQTVVKVSNMSDEKVVVFEDGFEIDGPDLCADGDDHEAQRRR